MQKGSSPSFLPFSTSFLPFIHLSSPPFLPFLLPSVRPSFLQKDGTVREFVFAFDSHFEAGLDAPLSFPTHPEATCTHWKQCVMCLKAPLVVKAGDTIKGSAQLVNRDRDLEVHMTWGSPMSGGESGANAEVFSQKFKCGA
jgi:hypothetical protein